MKKLGKEAKEGATDSAASVLDAIVEGDAERVQHLYRDVARPTQQREALDAAEQSEATQARPADSSRSRRWSSPCMTAPYTLGEGLVQTVAANGGNAAVDRLFRRPPTHETALLDPFRVLAGDTRRPHVPCRSSRRARRSSTPASSGC